MAKLLYFKCLILMAVLIAVATTSAQNIEYVNSMYWTGVYDVKVRGDYAYCCFDPGLVIFDILDIEHPAFVSRLNIIGENFHIEIFNDYAYIFGNHDKLRIINISDVDEPWLAGEIPIDAEIDNIWVDGQRVYAAAGIMGMVIIDISDPASPEIITTFNTDGDTKAVVVRDTVAFVAERHIYPSSYSFQIVNIADIQNPVTIGHRTQDLGWNKDLLVEGNYAYLANSYRGFIIIDISDLTQPWIIAQLEDTTYPWNLAKSGDFIFMDYGFDSLQVFDVSNPQSPELLAEYELSMQARDFDISGDYLYIASSYSGLSILNISDIYNISQISEHNTPGATSLVFNVGGYLYLHEAGFGLRIHDLSNPANPNRVYNYENAYCSDYDLTDEYLYTLDGNGLELIDVTDPSSPAQIFRYHLENSFEDVCVKGPYIYFTSFNEGVFVYEGTEQDSLEYIRGYANSSFSFDVEIENNIGYFSQDFALQIYDLTDPEDSVLLSSIMPASGAGLLYVHNGFVYTQLEDGQRSSDVSIIDAVDPANPEPAGFLTLPGPVSDICFYNELGYFSVYPNELHIYDLSNPYNPIFLCSCSTSGFIREAQPIGDYIYVADNSSLIILRYTPTGLDEIVKIPIDFALSANFPNPFNAQTQISFNLPQSSAVNIDIFDLGGRKVANLLNRQLLTGPHSVIWDAKVFASGIYFYRLQAGEFQGSRKMMLVK